MGEIGRWHKYTFEISSKNVVGWNALAVTGASELEGKSEDSGSTEYVKRKGAKPIEITMTVILAARLGIDVYNWAMSFVADAKNGKEDYLYIGSKKVIPYQLMLTQAKVDKIDISPKGKWKSAQVKLTFKQSQGSNNIGGFYGSYGDYDGGDDDDDGGGSHHHHGGSKRSVRSSSVTTTQSSGSSYSGGVDAVSGAAFRPSSTSYGGSGSSGSGSSGSSGYSSHTQSAISHATSVNNSAKSYSSTSKTTYSSTPSTTRISGYTDRL